MPPEIFQAWAVALGGLSSLGSALAVLMLLNRKSGPAAGFAFGLTYFGAYVSIGLAAVFLGGDLFTPDGDGGPSRGSSIALCVLGLLLASASVSHWRTPPDTEPPAFFKQLDELHPLRVMAFGLLIPAINFKNLAIFLPAMALLTGAALEPVPRALAVLSTATVFCGGLLAPLLIYALLPNRSAQWLAAMRAWIERNSHKVIGVLLPIIAVLMLAKGGYNLWLLYGG